MRKWTKKNRLKVRAAKNEWYRLSKGGTVRKWIRHGKTGTPEYAMLKHCANRAKDAGLPFNLEIQDIVIPARCPVLGIELRPAKGRPDHNSPSLDKIIPSLGYVRGNVRVISWRANLLKNNGTPAELRLVANDSDALERNGFPFL